MFSDAFVVAVITAVIREHFPKLPKECSLSREQLRDLLNLARENKPHQPVDGNDFYLLVRDLMRKKQLRVEKSGLVLDVATAPR